mmetsp:Transcript_67/g.172  ORF Transcript_67/g.172 Transcript_67/m.172 type:complete len:203 (+) Transcript_67:200-808(+)
MLAALPEEDTWAEHEQSYESSVVQKSVALLSSSIDVGGGDVAGVLVGHEELEDVVVAALAGDVEEVLGRVVHTTRGDEDGAVGAGGEEGLDDGSAGAASDGEEQRRRENGALAGAGVGIRRAARRLGFRREQGADRGGVAAFDGQEQRRRLFVVGDVAAKVRLGAGVQQRGRRLARRGQRGDAQRRPETRSAGVDVAALGEQ